MIDNILQIEKIGKILLRFGMVIYLLFIGILNFTNSLNTMNSKDNWILDFLLLIIVVATSILLLMHYKTPKLGAIGGGLAAILFLITVVFLSYLEISAGVPISMTFLHIIKDIMLCFSALILTGESLKEMIREKITKPFPVR